jgi:hypothetical protein
MSSTKEKFIFVLRFIAILPSTILIYLIIRGIANFILHISWGQDDEFPFMLKYIAPVLCNAAGGYWSVYTAVQIAPIFKKGTSILISFIYFILLVIVLYYYTLNQVFSFSTLLEQIGLFIGSLMAAYYTIKNINLL